jgi:uncharacterized protein (DUF1697 family)
MTVYVAFLRAINVSGRFVTMARLAEAFRRLGHEDARTFINSGNVIFSASAGHDADLAAAIEARLPPLLGFESGVFLRRAPGVRAIATRAAQLRPRVPEGEVNVAFLAEPASTQQSATVAELRSTVDDFIVDGSEVYWLCRTRQSDSRFSNALLERRLRVRSTLRRSSMLDGLAAQLR